jgi:hypothetical protein
MVTALRDHAPLARSFGLDTNPKRQRGVYPSLTLRVSVSSAFIARSTELVETQPLGNPKIS